MTGPKVSLAEGRKHLARVLEDFERGRWQLLGILNSLPESSAELGDEDVSDEWDALTELRNTIACVLEDYVRPTLEDLQGLLAAKGEEREEP